MLADQDQGQGAATVTPTQKLVGYVRLANREKGASWNDFLFRYADDGDIGEVLSNLKSADEIVKTLVNGKPLVVKTNVSLRATFPAVTIDGLVFAKQVGFLNEGDTVKVIDARIVTTTRTQFSQIWLKIEK